MNTPLLLTQFTPAEVFVIQKGYYTNRCELLRQMLHYFVHQNWLEIQTIDNELYVAKTSVNAPEKHEFGILSLTLYQLSVPRIPFSNFIHMLVESVEEDKLIRGILRRLKKTGYFTQNILGWLTGNFELTPHGQATQTELNREIRILSDFWKTNEGRKKIKPVVDMLGANQWFVTRELPDYLQLFQDRWKPTEARVAKAREQESGCGSGCSGCSGCGGGCGGCGGGCGS
ncbi:MAG: hypothetical protein MUC87_14100 [Bacteroidia bacterium]|jgi:hypothetical protein|nr:hypothetical protein [Bacteroidia bacterium]